MHPKGPTRSRPGAGPEDRCPKSRRRGVRGRLCCFSVPGSWSPRQGLPARHAGCPTLIPGGRSPKHTKGRPPRSYPERPSRRLEKRELLEGDLGAFALELGLRLLGGLLV